jgi:tetratricopeptide (TPR) repeat protein
VATHAPIFKPTFNVVRTLLLTASLALLANGPAAAQTVDETLLDIENRWAVALYASSEQEKEIALTQLLRDVRAFAANHSDNPEAVAWHGIIARECTRAHCQSRSKKFNKEARDALLKAEALDPYALGGRIYANLGALYSQTSSVFGGFGSKVKGIGYLWRAIIIDPHGLESNYLYAELLVDENNLEEARQVLLKASGTPVRPSHLLADRGRQQEILLLLQKVEDQLNKQT